MGKPLHLTIQSDVFVILGVTILLCLAVIALSKKIDKTDPLAKPHGLVLLAIMLVETLDNQVKDNVGPRIAKNLSPYVTTIAIYIFLSNILGLFGFSSPTGNYSVTLMLTIVTWVLVQIAQLKAGGFKEFNIFDMRQSRMEYEANIFASQISLPDDEILEYIENGYDIQQIARAMHSI